ncbi:hypothetical protein FXB41_33250 [Bradyrhizobium canariense]|uniref:hypothetical protein n=1 Tax=Bradyrhizobium canariense TaxID=255045 RepID=UPI001CA5C213|nr:hypothetical protein [Bradyrhizobium canariense]MBW5439442.1 hypothetical protein [Bradyrhizobium canariense]
MAYYTAVRIPQAIDKHKLDKARKGDRNQENLLRLETRVGGVRKFDCRRMKIDSAVAQEADARFRNISATLDPAKALGRSATIDPRVRESRR